MSLSTLHNAKLSLTSSFRGSLNSDHVDEPELWISFRKTASKRPGEKTPLIKEVDRTDSQLKDKETISLTLLMTIFIVTLGSSFQFGYGTGVMNNSEEFMLSYFHNQGIEYTLVHWSITVSCYGIGGLLGSIIGPKVIGAHFGRKATLLWNNVFLALSSYLMIHAQAWWHQAIGRVFIGIVAGIATAVVPTYFSELSPISIRGAVGTMVCMLRTCHVILYFLLQESKHHILDPSLKHQLGITVGIVISQFLSTPSLHIFGSEDDWQYLFAVPVVFGALQCVVLPFCPESPSYLYQTQGREAAKKSLQRLQSDQDVVDVYLNMIEEEVRTMKHSQGTLSTKQLFSSKVLRKQLIVGIAVQLMMQFSGIDAVFYYSTKIFREAEVTDPELATTLLGAINVFITIVAVRYIDVAGRKILLTTAWIGLMASYLLLTISFIWKPYYDFMDIVSSRTFYKNKLPTD